MPPLGPTKHTLELLDLSVNNLMVVETNYFVGFHRLVTLYLNLNCLSVIPDIFPLAGTLSTFAISHNMVLSLKRFVNNKTFLKLRRLSVSHNNVSELTSVMISQWPRLIVTVTGPSVDLFLISRRSTVYLHPRPSYWQIAGKLMIFFYRRSKDTSEFRAICFHHLPIVNNICNRVTQFSISW